MRSSFPFGAAATDVKRDHLQHPPCVRDQFHVLLEFICFLKLYVRINAWPTNKSYE